MDDYSCPCCGDPIDAGLVVCWTCYYASDRLQPGTYTTYDVVETGDTWTITQEEIEAWGNARADRMGQDVTVLPHA